MGQLLGNGVRFGAARDVLAAGEGIETVLSLHCVMRRLPMVAALSANHLAALALPSGLRRLYIARDNDPCRGPCAAEALSARAEANGIETLTLTPTADDFNADLRLFGRDALKGVRCASSSRRRMSPASSGVEVRLFGPPAAPSILSAQFVRVGALPGWRRVAAFERAIGPESVRPPQRLRGISE